MLPQRPAVASVPSVPTEREVKHAVVEFYRMMGVTVWNLDQGFRPGGRRHGTTRQAKGLSDLYCTWPARGVAWWVELKRPGGELRPEQVRFRDDNARCGVTVVVGGVVEAVAHIEALRGVGAGRPSGPLPGDPVAIRSEAPRATIGPQRGAQGPP